MDSLTRRMKNAAKIMVGKEVGKTVKTHVYELQASETEEFLGQNVIVTGGTGAIGSAICFEFASRGATVAVCGRNSEKIDATISSMTQNNPQLAERLLPLVMDVTDENSISAAFDKWKESGRKLDIFVNNAGGQPGRVGERTSYIWEKETDQIDLLLSTNLRGTILCCCKASAIMTEQKDGLIINIGSVIGMGGKSGMSDYAASKAGVIGFTRSLALELGPFGVRCNCISPGLVNQTPFDGGSPEVKTKRNVLGRNGYTREVAETAVFVAQNKYITGQNITIDGGRSLGLFGDS